MHVDREILEGEVVEWRTRKNGKGYGLVKPKDYNTRIWFFCSSVKDKKPVAVGDKVLFKIISNFRGGRHYGKPEAIEVELLKPSIQSISKSADQSTDNFCQTTTTTATTTPQSTTTTPLVSANSPSLSVPVSPMPTATETAIAIESDPSATPESTATMLLTTTTTSDNAIPMTATPTVESKPLVEWTKEEVQRWFSCSEDFKQFASQFPLTGKALAGLSKEDYLHQCPEMGDVIYNAVQALKGEKNTPTSVFGLMIKKKKHKTDLNINLPFQNREAEIETIAHACLQNLKVSKLGPGEQSQAKTTLLSSAQMGGSGKSWLANHFLPQFQSPQFTTLRSKLEEEFGADAVNTLANSVYVGIDLRDWTDILNREPIGVTALEQFILCSLVGTLVSLYPADVPYWSAQQMGDHVPDSIIMWFSEKYGKRFFIHFDEVDLILVVTPRLEGNEVVGIEAAKRFYDFWSTLYPIISSENFLYLSGRSAILYAIGKGLYHSIDLKSPGNNKCLLLDTLKPQHIDNILAENPGIKDADTREYLASLLYHRTGGVPRFIGYAVEWLHKQGIGKDSQKEDIIADIFGDDFHGYLRDSQGAKSELYPLGALGGGSMKMRQLYTRLVALSALGAPLDINATLQNPEAWGIRKDGRNNFLEIPFLDVLRLFNLWIEKSPSDGQWRILFPDIVLDETAYQNKEDENLPYWIAFGKTKYAQAWDKGNLLERIVVNNMELAILDNLGIAKKSATFEERFPFLSQSSIGKEAAILSSSSPYGQLPKIVIRDKGQGTAVPLDSLSKEEREERLQLFRNYVAQAPSFLRAEIPLFKGDWKYLLEIVRPGTLYIPVAKSASADLIYFTSTMNSIHFQFKAEKALLAMDNIIKEAQKAYADPLVADGRKLTFVIVALKVNDETIKKKATPESKVVQVNQGKQKLSIVLQSGANLEGAKGETWKIPNNMDIVVVLEKGLEQLITKHNLKLFEEKQDVTIEDFVVNNK